MSEDVIGLLWLVVLLVANAFFVAGEFAVMGARRSQIEPRAEAGSRPATTALYAMEHVSAMLAVCQLGITVCSLLILNVSEPALHHLLVVPMEAVGVPAGVADIAAFVVALLVVTFLHVTFGEMIPKNAAVSFADRAVMLLAQPLVWLSRLLHPIIVSLNWAANLVLRAFGIEPKDEVASSFTLEEVQSIVAESTRSGTLEDESGVLHSALEFSSYTAGDVMVPLERVVTVPEDVTPQAFEWAVGRVGFSRFVVEDPDGGYTGYLHLKDVLMVAPDAYERPVPLTRIRSLANVRADDEVEDALALMQRTGSHLARVITTEGTTVGVLFLEDVLEELVGEIHDVTQTPRRMRLA
ncbi:hemolysin family protein [Micrococcus sp. 2A]|uniref:hemolysin family protein n=1 Tax=Micrococcus TaxID=1269 RepID=UPI002004D4C2|nr:MULTISPECIES: hemolysin family protein [unclassified Micrococcus]MCK6094478.1 hemolysin family protein [Micrococcus sp. EYE_212]MCK6170659.1 hemolysin family protein [Micrococcus sp. EYE_162]MDX2340894.1 hemolysin family protein [Micrococcus sp. M4NT]